MVGTARAGKGVSCTAEILASIDIHAAVAKASKNKKRIESAAGLLKRARQTGVAEVNTH
jgi:uncharacterized protein YjhX (UPF0386 family)